MRLKIHPLLFQGVYTKGCVPCFYNQKWNSESYPSSGSGAFALKDSFNSRMPWHEQIRKWVNFVYSVAKKSHALQKWENETIGFAIQWRVVA